MILDVNGDEALIQAWKAGFHASYEDGILSCTSDFYHPISTMINEPFTERMTNYIHLYGLHNYVQLYYSLVGDDLHSRDQIERLPLPPITRIMIDKQEYHKNGIIYAVSVISPLMREVVLFEVIEVSEPTIQKIQISVRGQGHITRQSYINTTVSYFEKGLIDHCKVLLQLNREQVGRVLPKALGFQNHLDWYPSLIQHYDFSPSTILGSQQLIHPTYSEHAEFTLNTANDSDLSRLRADGMEILHQVNMIHIHINDFHFVFYLKKAKDSVFVRVDEEEVFDLPIKDFPYFLDWFATRIQIFATYLEHYDDVLHEHELLAEIPRPTAAWFLNQYRVDHKDDKDLWPIGVGPIPTCDDIEEAIKLVQGQDQHFQRLVYIRLFNQICDRPDERLLK